MWWRPNRQGCSAVCTLPQVVRQQPNCSHYKTDYTQEPFSLVVSFVAVARNVGGIQRRSFTCLPARQLVHDMQARPLAGQRKVNIQIHRVLFCPSLCFVALRCLYFEVAKFSFPSVIVNAVKLFSNHFFPQRLLRQ